MLSFGVFCFDLVVNKNCSLGDHGEDQISWTRPKSFFDCFISSRELLDPYLRQELLDPYLRQETRIFFLDCLTEKNLSESFFLKVRKCAVLAVYV